ncbi:hypothetical protein LP420_25280 [Massilia sp. B-10]|nr:hypothetical protein LP420_25280 [Massilia sp. B-10]
MDVDHGGGSAAFGGQCGRLGAVTSGNDQFDPRRTGQGTADAGAEIAM